MPLASPLRRKRVQAKNLQKVTDLTQFPMARNSSTPKSWTHPPDTKPPIFVRSELDDYGLDVYEFRVLAHISRRQGKTKDGNTKGCYSKQKTIAEACGMSHRKAQDVLRVLCGIGLIEREQREGTTNLYKLAPASKWKHPKFLPRIREEWKFSDSGEDESAKGKAVEDQLEAVS